MVRLNFTTVDPHDALTRALAIFRVMDLPVLGFDGRYVESEFRVSILVSADPAIADGLLDRLRRLVSVRDPWARLEGANGCGSVDPHVHEEACILEQAAA